MTHKTSVALKFFRKYMQLKGIFLPIEQIISYCKYLKDEIKTRYVSFAEHLSFKHPRNWVSKLTNLLQELFKCFLRSVDSSDASYEAGLRHLEGKSCASVWRAECVRICCSVHSARVLLHQTPFLMQGKWMLLKFLWIIDKESKFKPWLLSPSGIFSHLWMLFRHLLRLPQLGGGLLVEAVPASAASPSPSGSATPKAFSSTLCAPVWTQSGEARGKAATGKIMTQP